MLTLPTPEHPVLVTDRLVLRRPLASDAHRMFVMRSDPHVMEHVNRPMTKTVEDAIALIDLIDARIAAGEALHWVITLKGEDICFGLIGLWRLVKEHRYGELGYTLMRDHWGKGYATEAIAAVSDLGFRMLGLHRIEAITRPGNQASIRALEKNGFVQEGHLKQNVFWNDTFHDSIVLGRLDPTTAA